MNKINLKRIGAFAGIILLIALYITTFILAFIKTAEAQTLFKGFAVATVGIPVVLYSYMLVYKYLKNRNTPKD